MMHISQVLQAFTLSLSCTVVVHGSAFAQVTGTATYRERMALPADAVFEATLEDVSKADAPATVLGRTRIERPGNPPIRFEIPYDSSRIDARHRYVVRARILVGAKPFFTTDQSYPVLTGGRGTEVSVLLSRAVGSGPASGGVAALGSLPATFIGDLPCADCPGIRQQLELFPDEAFFLRLSYLGRGDSTRFDDIGTWAVSSDRSTLTLFGGRDAPLKFAIRDSSTLRPLGASGAGIASSRNYDLTRTRNAQPLEPRLRMRGMYRYVADAGRFTECLTRQTWPVAQERDNAALESAYTKARREPGQELLVDLVGQVAMRPKMEGNGRERSLVVERFGGVWPGESCGSRTSTESLENTYWKLTRLGDTPVVVGSRQREPHFILHPDSRRVSGSDGCNRLTGRYELKGDHLTFSQMAGIRMACPDGMDTERRFLGALREASTATITRQHLELLDAAGKPLARFEARQMK